MRYRWTAVVTLLAYMFTAAGPARADAADTVRTADGYGVRLGSADAPVQLAIFCEPQCPICATFEAESNDQLVGELGSHRLAVTYRWLTFLDERRHNDVSAGLANALMTAADPATAPIAYQNFVAELYRHQGNADDVAAIARASGIPWWVADRIAAGDSSVDVAAMDADNHNRLTQADPEKPGTPTVYDLNANKVVDTEEPGWLDRLIQSG